MKIDIRTANELDKDGIWKVLSTAVEQGNACIYSYDMSFDDIMNHWFDKKNTVYVAEIENEIVGTFYLKPLNIGLSNHVATGDFVVLGDDKSRGVMRNMVQIAIQKAFKSDFTSMYVTVIQQNRRALRAFNHNGFHVTGSIPRAIKTSNGRYSAFVTLIRAIQRY
jgi:L-amino acid N-acyltransferase YncA